MDKVFRVDIEYTYKKNVVSGWGEIRKSNGNSSGKC